MEMVLVCNALLIWLVHAHYVSAVLCYRMAFVLQIVPRLRCTLQVECATTVMPAARTAPLPETEDVFDVLSASIIILITALKPVLLTLPQAQLLESVLVTLLAASASTQLLTALLVLTLLYSSIKEAASVVVQVPAT